MRGVNLEREPDLVDPVLVAAFSGWNDAGEAASAAVRWLVRRLPAQRMGAVEPELYHDFTSTRPTVRQASGERRITWPQHNLFYATDPERQPDLVLLVAREPELRWRGYCAAIIEAAQRLGVRRVITLGAFRGATPHNRPVPVTGFATSPELLRRIDALGLGMSSYAGPTGITSILNDAARTAGIPSASLWAAVPQYLPTTANPKAALSLARTLLRLLGIELDLRRLEKASAYFERQVDEAISRDRRAIGYVRELERHYDGEPESSPSPAGPLPSAEDVIRDLEDFLRSHSEDGPEA